MANTISQLPMQLVHAWIGGLLTPPKTLVIIADVLVGAPLDLVQLLNQLQSERREDHRTCSNYPVGRCGVEGAQGRHHSVVATNTELLSLPLL